MHPGFLFSLSVLLSVCHIYSYFISTLGNIWSVCSGEAESPTLGLGGDAGGSDGEGVGSVYMSGDTSGEVESIERASFLVCQLFFSPACFSLYR